MVQQSIPFRDISKNLLIKDRDLTAPPPLPEIDDKYIIKSPATGDWTGQDGDIAVWNGTTWDFYTPENGWHAEIEDEGELVALRGGTWTNVDTSTPLSDPPSIVTFEVSGSYTKPSGIKFIKIRGIAGGGGGGGVPETTSAPATSSGAGGGAGGGYFESYIKASNLLASTPFVIGAGGAGGPGVIGEAGDGLKGGDTTFGIITAIGGGGGQGGINIGSNFSTRRGGSGSIGSGGDVNTPGSSGAIGIRNLGLGTKGTGASSQFGGGGIGGAVSPGTSGSEDAIGFGAGGSGAASGNGGPAQQGGNGSGGYIIIEEYY